MNCDGRIGYFTRKIEKSEERVSTVSGVKVRKQWSLSVFQEFFYFFVFKKKFNLAIFHVMSNIPT